MPFQKREQDIEMSGLGDQKNGEGPQDTEYKSVDWKKIFLSPKYIRTLSRLRCDKSNPLNKGSLAHSRDSNPNRNCIPVSPS
jgi:hypothetical protein